jgi:hypothetical protein
MDNLMRLRIVTATGDIPIDNVQEYVCGRQYFYIKVLPTDEVLYPGVKIISRDIINEVYRSDGKSEWSIHLKTFRDR